MIRVVPADTAVEPRNEPLAGRDVPTCEEVQSSTSGS